MTLFEATELLRREGVKFAAGTEFRDALDTVLEHLSPTTKQPGLFNAPPGYSSGHTNTMVAEVTHPKETTRLNKQRSQVLQYLADNCPHAGRVVADNLMALGIRPGVASKRLGDLWALGYADRTPTKSASTNRTVYGYTINNAGREALRKGAVA